MIKIISTVVITIVMSTTLPVIAQSEVASVDREAIKQSKRDNEKSIQISEVSSEPKQTEPKPNIDIVKVNPNDCDHATEWILEDGTCKAKDVKPVEQQPSVASGTASGTKEQWMAAAGIPESEWWAVDSIVSRESGWNPNAVNPSSGACGLGQQLPCGKWAGAWNDPVAALKAQYQYVTQRYGSYAGAVHFWEVGSCATEYGCHWY